MTPHYPRQTANGDTLEPKPTAPKASNNQQVNNPPKIQRDKPTPIRIEGGILTTHPARTVSPVIAPAHTPEPAIVPGRLRPRKLRGANYASGL